MKILLRLLKLDFIPKNPDLALFVLRVWVGLSMLLLHGWGKAANFTTYVEMTKPLVINPSVTLGLAVLAEAVASVFLVLGLFTRFAALGGLITMSVAFLVVHGTALSGEASGELAFLYLASYVTLFIAGGGRFALDRKIG